MSSVVDCLDFLGPMKRSVNRSVKQRHFGEAAFSFALWFTDLFIGPRKSRQSTTELMLELIQPTVGPWYIVWPNTLVPETRFSRT